MARKCKKPADATTTPDKAFPFEKLPPELRNMVYEYHLVTPRQVLITRRRQRQNGIIGARGPFNLYSLAVADGEVSRNATAKKKSLLGLTGSSLLRVSKSIHEETESMLYSANRFLFTRNVAAMQFLHELGPRIQLLRHVSFDIYTISSIDRIKPLFDKLRSANDKLETLEVIVQHSSEYGPQDAEKLARFHAFRFAVHIHRHQHRLEDAPSDFKYEVLSVLKTEVREKLFGI
ncbi:hypothetical protein KC320_g3586 [Hortaea werneckii]|nr:hypothetical protein KC320_g3586 [Hortaea werneckii]